MVDATRWGMIVIDCVFLWGLVVPFDLVLRFRTRISLLGALRASEPPRSRQSIVLLGSGGLAVMLLYPIVLFAQRDLLGSVVLFQSEVLMMVGVLLLMLSIVLIFMAIVELARVYLRNDQEIHVISIGVYGLCRNPVYVGMTLGLLGVFCLLPTGVYLIAWLFYVAGNHVRIWREENYLRLKYEQEFEAYCQSVGRYGPRLKFLK